MDMAKGTIGMILQASEDHRSAGRTAGGGAEGVGELHAVPGQCVEVGRVGGARAEAAAIQTMVVGYHQDDVGAVVAHWEFPIADRE